MRSQLLAVTLVRYSSGPRAGVPRLSTRLNMSTGFCVTSTTMIAAPTLVGCGLRLFLNFRLGQVAGEQEVALDGADVRRPLGGDPERVVGKEIEIAGQL